MESAVFQFVPVASSPLIHYYWKESVSAFFIRSLQNLYIFMRSLKVKQL